MNLIFGMSSYLSTRFLPVVRIADPDLLSSLEVLVEALILVTKEDIK